MPSTKKRCAGKSTKSLEQTNLIYHRNFWDFYLANRTKLDKYLECAVSKYCYHIPAEDLKQEILVSLHDRDILKEYDPEKSRLNTFITNWFTWQAAHFSVVQKRRNRRRVLTADLNEMPETRNSHVKRVSVVEPSKTDEDIIAKEFLRDLRAELPEYQHGVLGFLIEEYSQRDIAEEFDNSPACICQHTRQIRKCALNLTKRTKDVK